MYIKCNMAWLGVLIPSQLRKELVFHHTNTCCSVDTKKKHSSKQVQMEANLLVLVLNTWQGVHIEKNTLWRCLILLLAWCPQPNVVICFKHVSPCLFVASQNIKDWGSKDLFKCSGDKETVEKMAHKNGLQVVIKAKNDSAFRKTQLLETPKYLINIYTFFH